MSIAGKRIDRLHALAREAASDRDHDHARECIRLTRRATERNRCGLPRAFRWSSYDDCDAYLHPGINTHVRARAGDHVVIRCDCGVTKRCPY